MTGRGWRRRWAALSATLLWLSAAAILAAAPGLAEAPRTWRLAFEVLSSQHAEPARKATYEEKERLTRAALAELVPHVWTNLGAVASRARSRVRAGGYKDEINPAIQSNLVTGEAEARRLAAALGYVFRQWAVLMYDLDAEPATFRYVSVRFPRGTLTVVQAERFFARARAQLASEKLGFSAAGNRLVFINLHTGIADDAFFAGLTRAGADLPGVAIKVEPAKPVRAFLIENDWAKSKDGEEFARVFAGSGAALAALGRLRARHDGRVRRWAQQLR
jgi:hypothetical protein